MQRIDFDTPITNNHNTLLLRDIQSFNNFRIVTCDQSNLNALHLQIEFFLDEKSIFSSTLTANDQEGIQSDVRITDFLSVNRIVIKSLFHREFSVIGSLNFD